MSTAPLLYILDEDRLVLSLAELFREDTPFEVVAMTTAGELLQACRTRKPDVILVELAVFYGEAAKELDAETDPWMILAAVRALTKLKGEGLLANVHVVLMHTGSFMDDRELFRLQERDLVQDLWAKPFCTWENVSRLCQRFNMPNPYPGMIEWSPDESDPPE